MHEEAEDALNLVSCVQTRLCYEGSEGGGYMDGPAIDLRVSGADILSAFYKLFSSGFLKHTLLHLKRRTCGHLEASASDSFSGSYLMPISISSSVIWGVRVSSSIAETHSVRGGAETCFCETGQDPMHEPSTESELMLTCHNSYGRNPVTRHTPFEPFSLKNHSCDSGS